MRARCAGFSVAARSTSAAASAKPVRRAAQSTALAAESITDIWCQRTGSAWQNACIAACGFGRKASLTTKITPEVPSETKPCPASTAPMPTALAALSPPPPATTTPSGRPQRRANSPRSLPPGALPSTSVGMCARVRPVA